MKKIRTIISEEINKSIENSDIWLTRKELAKMAGVSETTLYNVLKGKGSLDSTEKVAIVLNIDIFNLK